MKEITTILLIFIISAIIFIFLPEEFLGITLIALVIGLILTKVWKIPKKNKNIPEK